MSHHVKRLLETNLRLRRHIPGRYMSKHFLRYFGLPYLLYYNRVTTASVVSYYNYLWKVY